MKPTIVEGDYILVNKLAYDLKVPFIGQRLLHRADPRRGDIVVFVPPGETDRFVKRVVAGPGDVVEMRDNVLFVNGQPASYEPLVPISIPPEDRPGHRFERETVAGRSHAVMLTPGKWSADNFAPLVMPSGCYFMLGDNRDDSRDSRYFGPVSRDRIIGRAWSVSLSLEPGHGPRWQRFFSVLT
jgi:signal peptidase I